MVGTPVSKPTPVFTKLDPSVVDEPTRLGASGTASMVENGSSWDSVEPVETTTGSLMAVRCHLDVRSPPSVSAVDPKHLRSDQPP